MLRSRIRKYFALPLADQFFFWRCWCLLGWYRLALRFVSLKTLTEGLERSTTSITQHALAAEAEASAGRIGYLVTAAATATPWESTCLVQVLVVHRLLSRRGIPGQFCLGVNREGSAREAEHLAHAWVECGGMVVNGGDSDDFAVIACYRWP